MEFINTGKSTTEIKGLSKLVVKPHLGPKRKHLDA